MPNKLTKADIIGGRFARVKDVYIEEWDGSVTLWSLTDGQMAHVEALRVRGMDLNFGGDLPAAATDPTLSNAERSQALLSGSTGMRIDIEAMTYSDALADAQAVAYALSGGGEKWEVADVQQMRPASVVKLLVKEVYALSGVDKGTANAVAQFLPDGRSDGDMLSDQRGSAAGSDASGAYTAATELLAERDAGVHAAHERGDERPVYDSHGDPITL